MFFQLIFFFLNSHVQIQFVESQSEIVTARLVKTIFFKQFDPFAA